MATIEEYCDLKRFEIYTKMRVEEFEAWVRSKNIRNNRRSLYINTTGKGPMVYMIPVRPEHSTKVSVKVISKPEKETKGDDEGVSEEKDAESVDGI